MHPVIDISFIISFVLLEVERVKAQTLTCVLYAGYVRYAEGISADPTHYLQMTKFNETRCFF